MAQHFANDVDRYRVAEEEYRLLRRTRVEREISPHAVQPLDFFNVEPAQLADKTVDVSLADSSDARRLVYIYLQHRRKFIAIAAKYD